MEWNEEKAQKVVRKHKSRFSLRLTLKIVRVIAAIFFIFTLYKIGIGVFYHMSSIGNQTEYYQKLAIDWTEPQLTTDLSGDANHEITSLFTQKMSMPVYRRIGLEEYTAAELQLSKPLVTSFTNTELTTKTRYVEGKQFTFNLPENPKNNQKLPGDEYTNAWEILDMVDEGHVADLAFSTSEYYSPEELLELLSDYDVAIHWMPLYMGEYQAFEEGGTHGGEHTMSLFNQWGLAGERTIDEDYQSGSMVSSLTESTLEESQTAMLENMQRMINHKQKLAEQLLHTTHLEERYHYVNEHGFQVFGAVITGPVKELLKLQELDELHSVQMGEIEYWNWVK